MTSIAAGIHKKVIAAKQATRVVDGKTTREVAGKTTAAADLVNVRRVSSSLDLKKEFYTSNEIRTSQQRIDGRQGVHSVSGSINGELSVGSYAHFFASALRRGFPEDEVLIGSLTDVVVAEVFDTVATTFTATSPDFIDAGLRVGMRISFANLDVVVDIGRHFIITELTATVITALPVNGVAATPGTQNSTTVAVSVVGKVTLSSLTGVVVAAVSDPVATTFTATSAHFIGAGLRVGMLISFAGLNVDGDNVDVDSGRHFIITVLTDTVITALPVNGVAATAGAQTSDSVAVSVVGKVTHVPVTGHTRDYWTIEHNFSKTNLHELFVDCVIGGVNIRLPATGMSEVEFPIVGLNMIKDNGNYFENAATSPQADGGLLAAANGLLLINGEAQVVLTSFDINVNGNVTVPGGVVGSNIDPDVLPGVIDVSGSMSMLFSNGTNRDYFLNEDVVSVQVILTTTDEQNSPFISIYMPKVKFSSADKDDGEKSLVMTMNYVALEDETATDTNGKVRTTIMIQDSGA